MNKVNLNYLYLIIFFIITILLRLYNINYDDFWIDEIISFYVSDPDISIKEFFLRHKTLENSPFLFNLILRIYFDIFGYNTDIARLFPAFCNIFSIFILVYFYKKYLDGKSFVLILTLLAFNIYSIKYSQELRLYSWYLLIFISNIYFFYKLINFKEKSKINNVLFLITSILLILTHPFSLIIIFSYSVFVIHFFLVNKYFPINLLKNLVIINIFSIIFLIFFVLNTTHQPIWIENIDLKFFTNFFFSKFFGSRLVGGIYLLVFIYLIFKVFKDIFYRSNIEIFLIYTIFFSYLIPIIYSYALRPAMVDRYLIYLVIIIILLICLFIDKINNKNLRSCLKILLIIFTLGNFSTETTFKQFFNERTVHKPDLKSTLIKINESNSKNYTLNLEATYLSKNEVASSFQNYIFKYKKIDNLNLNFINYANDNQKSQVKKLWIICLFDLNGQDCSLPNKLKNSDILNEFFYNSINLKLIEQK